MDAILIFAAGAFAGGVVGYFLAALIAVAGRCSDDERNRQNMHIANRRGYTEGWREGYERGRQDDGRES